MKELSLHILDLCQNAVTAGAKLVEIAVAEDPAADLLEITISDDGCGMDAAFLAQVTDPFTTTRTTRKVGLGIPLWKLAAEMTGGRFSAESAPGKGTRLYAAFVRSHIDTPPLGDMGGTFCALLSMHPRTDFRYTHRRGEHLFSLDTREMREALGGVPLDTPEVAAWAQEAVREGERELAKQENSLNKSEG